jgi:hypothetical protein
MYFVLGRLGQTGKVFGLDGGLLMNAIFTIIRTVVTIFCNSLTENVLYRIDSLEALVLKMVG